MRRKPHTGTWIVLSAYSIIAAIGAQALEHALMSMLCGAMLMFSVLDERNGGA